MNSRNFDVKFECKDEVGESWVSGEGTSRAYFEYDRKRVEVVLPTGRVDMLLTNFYVKVVTLDLRYLEGSEQKVVGRKVVEHGVFLKKKVGFKLIGLKEKKIWSKKCIFEGVA